VLSHAVTFCIFLTSSSACTDDCKPIISPGNAYGLFRAVRDCRAPIYGFRDPPIALTKENDLGDPDPPKPPPPAAGPAPPVAHKPTPVAGQNGAKTEAQDESGQDPGMSGLGAIILGGLLPRPPPNSPVPSHGPSNVVPAAPQSPSPPDRSPTAPPGNREQAPSQPGQPPQGQPAQGQPPASLYAGQGQAPGASPAAAPAGIAPGIAPTITVGTAEFTANAANQYDFAGQTLSPGGPPIVYSNQIISLGPSASVIAIGSSTQILRPNLAGPTPAITIGPNLILNPDPSRPNNYVFDSQTLIPGAPAINIDGTIVSLEPSGTALVVDGVTRGLPSQTALTIGAQVATANAAGQLVFGSQTLLPGSAAINIDGTSVSLDSSGTAVWVNGQLLSIGPSGLVATANAVTFGSQTLLPGGAAITVDGEMISLNPAGTAIVIDSASTETVTPGGPPITIDGTVLSFPVLGATSTEAWLGQYILRGLGATGTEASTAYSGSPTSKSKPTSDTARKTNTRGAVATSGSEHHSENHTPDKNLGSRATTFGGMEIVWEVLMMGSLIVGLVYL
jgi:hypothetical protein